MWRREVRKKKRSWRNAMVAPRFEPVTPTLQNISELLSIIGMHANVTKVTRRNLMKKTEVYGWLGAGNVASIMKYSDTLVLVDDFVQLNKYTHGEISTAIIDIISGFPDALESSVRESQGQPDIGNKNLLIEAAFAQHFIFTKEESSLENTSEQSILWDINEAKNIFCLALRGDNVFLITDDKCFDATEYFVRKVWQQIDSEVYANFGPLLCDEDFKNSTGRLFAVSPDRKLKLIAELEKLLSFYTSRFGNYELDKSLSAEDWEEISSLNASISEAESFELEVDEEHSKKNLSAIDVSNLSAVISEERFNLFQRVKSKERELWAEQKKFKYSLIPGKDVAEARARYYETLLNDSENETMSLLKKTKLLTALRDSSKGNL